MAPDAPILMSVPLEWCIRRLWNSPEAKTTFGELNLLDNPGIRRQRQPGRGGVVPRCSFAFRGFSNTQ
jgi:hypothetical protein